MTQPIALNPDQEQGRSGWTPLRILVVSLCFILNMLDGADMSIMSLVAPAMAADWNVSPQSLGVIFSASLAGMAVGCLLVAPQADRFGRRNIILGALIVIAVAMIGSGYVTTIPQLIIARFIVGIGVGTIGVSMTAMAAEFAPARYASFAVGFVQAGWPVAAVITAFVAAEVIPSHGWQVLLVGIGALSLVLLALLFVLLPESLAFLQNRQPAGALEKLNKIYPSLGLQTLTSLPAPAADGAKFSIAVLFRDGRARNTIFLWLAVTLGFFVFYFINSWIPKLASQAGLPMDQAIYAGAANNAGAALGTAIIGWLSVRYGVRGIVPVFFAFGVVALLIFGGVKLPLSVTLLAVAIVGLCINGGFNGFWALGASLYPAEIRSTGIGWAFGIGRIGAVLGPIVGGILVGAKLPISVIFALFTIPLMLSAGLCLMIKPKSEAQ
jgi:benzoate transport